MARSSRVQAPHRKGWVYGLDGNTKRRKVQGGRQRWRGMQDKLQGEGSRAELSDRVREEREGEGAAAAALIRRTDSLLDLQLQVSIHLGLG